MSRAFLVLLWGLWLLFAEAASDHRTIKDISQKALKPDVATFSVDRAAKIHSVQGSQVPKLLVRSELLQSGVKRLSVVHPTSPTCTYFKDRQFNYTDDVCGSKLYHVENLLDAFRVEQKFWARQGDLNPWWAVLSGMQHGKNPSLKDRLNFYQSGVEWLNEMKPLFQQFDLLKPAWVAKARALDFGCGLGRMSNALVRLGFQQTLCVDQAQTFLDEASRSLSVLRGQGAVVSNIADKVKFVHSAPDLLCVVAPGSVDFVHSVITLQHMKPMLQVAYIEQLCDALKLGGCGYFQIPVMINGMDKARHCDLGTNGDDLEMHYTPKFAVEHHLTSRGCRVLSATEKDRIGPIGTSMQFVFDKPDRSREQRTFQSNNAASFATVSAVPSSVPGGLPSDHGWRSFFATILGVFT